MLSIRIRDLLLAAVVPFVLACALNAQSVERRVSWTDREAKASWPVSIAVSTDGLQCVTWENGSCVLEPDGSLRDSIRPFAAIDGCLYASGDNGFAFLRSLDSTWVDTGYRYLSKMYHFDVQREGESVSIGDTMFHSLNYYDQGPDFAKFEETPRRVFFARSGRGVLVSAVFETYWKPGQLYYRDHEPRWSYWPAGGESFRYIGPRNDVTWPFRVGNDLLLAGMTESGIPHLLLRKRIHKPDRELMVLQRLDPHTGAIDSVRVLDTLAAAADDRLSVFIPYDDGTADVLCLLPDSDTLELRRYDTNDRLVDERILCPEIRIWEHFPAVTHERLDDGTHLLLWSRVEASDTTRLYVQAFDAEWNELRVPQRVSDVNTHTQVMGGFAVRQNMVDIAWLDSRDTIPSVYMKSLPIDRLTAIADISAEKPTAITLFPNPVPRGCASVSVIPSASQGSAASIRVIDILGRVRHSLPAGTSLPVTGLTAGIYVVEYSENGSRSTVKLLVE
ncbi:MAG: T9SS type A sorting domain-containing protein [Bacteroidetes bacterium]|nr:T9SS type A sorting domain-containing protein [Bacteroidota bacterium]